MGISAMHAAATGMKALDTKLNVLANNLANINTVGFKRSRTNFEDLMYQTLREPGVRNAEDEPNPHGILVGQLQLDRDARLVQLVTDQLQNVLKTVVQRCRLKPFG